MIPRKKSEAARAAMKYLVLYADDLEDAEPADITRAIATVRQWLAQIENENQPKQLDLWSKAND